MFPPEGWVSVSPSASQSRRITPDQVLFGSTVTTSYGIEFLDFSLQPIITTFDMVMPSRSTSEGYLLQIVELHPIRGILWTDLFLSGDTAHTMDYSPVVALEIMQTRWGGGQVLLVCRCKVFLWKWWEMSGRWGWALGQGAHWIGPMLHGTLWVHSRPARLISPQGSRRMAPPQSSPFPLWPMSLVINKFGQPSTSFTPKGSGFRLPEIALHLQGTQLEQATRKPHFVLTPERQIAQGVFAGLLKHN